MPPEEATPVPQPPVEPVSIPASPVTASGYESNPLSFIKPSWEGTKLNVRPILAVIGIFIGIGIVFAILVMLGIMLMSSNIWALVAIMLLVFVAAIYFITVWLAPGMVRLQLAAARQQKLLVSDVFKKDTQVGWKLFVTGLLVTLAIIGGIILLIVPGLIFMVWFSLTAFVVVEEGLTGTAALSRSRELVRNRFWDVAGALSLSQAAGIMGIVPILGPIAAAIANIILMPASALRYDQIVALKKTSDGTGISVHPMNYVLIVLALFVGGADSRSKAIQPPAVNAPVEKTVRAY